MIKELLSNISLYISTIFGMADIILKDKYQCQLEYCPISDELC